MLVLSRREQETVLLLVAGQTIAVQVLELRGDRVRLGITAPQEVRVLRKEIQEREQGKSG